MSRLVRIVMAVVLLTTMLYFVGCKKDELPEGGELPQTIEINPEYVPINWDNAQLIMSSSNDSLGIYQIHFDGQVPDIHPGSIVSIVCDTMVYHRFVTEASVSGNTVVIFSVEAYLTDIFSNADFTLATSPASKSTFKGATFYPVRSWTVDKYGQKKMVKINGKDENETHITYNLWRTESELNGLPLYSTEHFNAYMQELSFVLNFDLNMYMNFGGRTVREVLSNGLERYRSETMNINAYLDGSFNTRQVLRCDVTGNAEFDLGYEIIRHNLFQPVYAEFMVGPVPVVLKLNCDLYRQVQVTASGQISAYTGFEDEVIGRLGFEWRQGSEMSKVTTFSNDFSVVPPTLEGKGQLQAKAWLFPRVRVLLYGILGPSFDIKPYVSTTVTGGFREDLLGQTNDYCAWNFNCSAGLDACCGLSLQFIGYEKDNWSTDDWNIVDWVLFHSPHRITYASGRPNPNQSSQVRFYVFDKNYLLNTEVLTDLWQIVKFEANGMLSSEYGIAHNGIVQVSWSPSSDNDFLTAKLFDSNGNVISQDTVHVAGWTPPSYSWINLGLPSGTLWASCNVGATSPEEFGYYFSWGETQPKNYYDMHNYRYCSNDFLSKYCNNSSYGYNGYVDNLTILQSMDDAAKANWGNEARTPTKTEWMELIQYTNHSFVMENGVGGYRYTGNNGASIFIPANGWKIEGEVNEVGECGSYWSSSLDTGNPLNAWSYDFDSEAISWGRFHGFGVRPVRSPSKK